MGRQGPARGAVHAGELAALVQLEGDLPPGAAKQLCEIERRVGSRDAIYISTPITTGQRFLRWKTSHRADASDPDYERLLKREVMDENRRALKPLRKLVEERFPGTPFIDPSELNVDGWSQVQYHRFWVEVLERFARAVVFADGWQYSTGCSIEFAAASALSLPMFNARLEQLTASQGISLIEEASGTVSEAGLDDSTLKFAASVAALAIAS